MLLLNIAVQRKMVLQSTFIRKKRSCIRETENVIALIMFSFVTKLILKLINVHMYYWKRELNYNKSIQ